MKTAKFSRISALLALLLVATMLMTLVSCGESKAPTQLVNDEGDNGDTIPSDDVIVGGDSTTTPSVSGDATTDPSASDGSTTDPSVSGSNTTAPSVSGNTAPSVSGNTAPSVSGNSTAPSVSGNSTAPTKPAPSGNATVGTSSSATASTTAAKPSGDVLADAKNAGISGANVKMLIWWTAGKDDKAEADNFSKATGAKVAYETAAMNQYQTNLSAKVMSRNAPALAAIINEWYPQPITRKLMQPVSNVSGWNFKDNSIYALSLMDQFSYKGEYYGIALKGSNMTTFEVMFFNKSILSKSGVKIGKDDPYTLWKAGKWNWETCLEIAKKCNKNGIFGMSNVGQYFWMLSSGEDFVKSTKAGLRNNVNSAGVLNAWSWNWELIYKHKVVDTSYTGQTPFYQGKAAMLGAGSYMMQADSSHSNYVPQNMKDPWGVVPFPSPKGKTVAGCEGTVWGFPKGVEGKTLQAAAWYLRYYLDDYTYSARDFYPQNDCWEVMKWMWDQQIQSYNSVGILTYGGEHTAYTIQYSLVDEADTKAKLNANLKQWEGVLTANIKKIESELG